VALHNMPLGISVGMPVYFATGSRWKALGMAAMAGLSALIGAFVGWAIIAKGMSNALTGVLFGFVIGIMVWTALKELIPQARNYDKTDVYSSSLIFFGFIVMDGNGALFGTLQGNSREVITKFSVDLPKKHGRGGQSALRFARLRMEKRHNYVRKVAETAVQCFITDDKVNVTGLILAGLADFKTELHQSDMFDPRLQVKVLKRVDVSYGGENGFNQAIELAAETLGDVKFIQEKKLISRYFDEVSKDSGQYCFGIEETLKALEMGAVETLIVWENFDVMRYVLRNTQTQETKTIHLRSDQEKEKTHFQDKETGVELEHVEEMPLLEWFANNYKNFGATLEIVTDKSQEGSQFVRGFGGVGGILRYRVDLQNLNVDEDAEAIDYSDYD